MNNKMLNREFTNNMRIQKKNFNAKSGLTDSEDEDTSTKSSSHRSPGRSQLLSGRSSLLSARSPRDDSPRKPGNQTRFLENLSPKSPRVDPRMSNRSDQSEGSLPRFQNASRRANTLLRQDTANDEDRLTPRTSRSTSEKDDLGGMNMLSTMRHPMNENQPMSKSKPTKLSNLSQKQSVSSQRRTTGNRFNDDIDEESSRSRSRSGGNSTEQALYGGGGGGNSNFGRKQNSVSPRHEPMSPKSPSRFGGRSPRDNFDSKKFESGNDRRWDRDVNNERRRDQDEDRTWDRDYDHRKIDRDQERTSPRIDNDTNKQIDENQRSPDLYNKTYDKPRQETEKDPEVEETVEDTRTAKRLQQQREEKRLEREKRAKNQTEATKNIESAIEMVENTMEDSMRLTNLREKNSDLKYPSKPKLDEKKVMLTQPNRLNRSLSARGPRDRRSSTGSGPIYRDKFSHVKPKTMTRLPMQTARTDADENKLNGSILNDSSSIRENIYHEWYQKKMIDAKENLVNARAQQRDGEEAKAQELIRKLKKSQVEYKKWMETKEQYIQKQREKMSEARRKEQEAKQAKREQKQMASKAFEQWVRIKSEKLTEQKSENRSVEKTIEKEKRTEKKSTKPPLPFDAWNKRKEEQINQKLNSEKEKLRLKKQEEREKEERKKLAEISYLEWLDKKEVLDEQKSNLNRSMSNSMTSIRVPFYPNSRTIPFGR